MKTTNSSNYFARYENRKFSMEMRKFSIKIRQFSIEIFN